MMHGQPIIKYSIKFVYLKKHRTEFNIFMTRRFNHFGLKKRPKAQNKPITVLI